MKINKQKTVVSVWLLFIAAFLIVVFFIWYFFIYVNSQEKLLIQKSFRALTQLGENIKNRYDSYRSIIESTDMDTLLYKSEKLDFKEINSKIKRYSFGMEANTATSSPKDSNNYVYFSDGSNNILKQIKYISF